MIFAISQWQFSTQKNNICQKKGSLTSHLQNIFNSYMYLFCKISHFLFKKVSQVSCEKFSVFFLHKSPEKIIPSLFSLGVKKFLLNTKINIDFESQFQIERMMLCITDIHIMIIIFSRKVS